MPDRNMKEHPVLVELRPLLGFSPTLDSFMTATLGRPIVDFIGLDKILKTYWKHEYTESFSQNEFIKNKFGARTLELLNKLL